MAISPTKRSENLIRLRDRAEACTACRLHRTRDTVVFGEGSSDADLMFVGEAPGAEENLTGRPFVGRSGGLLDRLLDGIGISRDQVYIANVIKCQPPENRDPAAVEIERCKPFLEQQVEIIEPSLICTLGNFATKLLSGSPAGITKVHGRATEIVLGKRTVTLYPLFHPAAAMRSPRYAADLSEDFALIPELLAGLGGNR